MLVIVGWIIVMVCVIGGYMAMGGKLGPLWQPFELVIIGGAGVGAFIVATPKFVLAKAGYAFKASMRGPKYNKEDYLELLSLMYAVFKLAKTKGMLAIESHIERPEESDLFKAFPKFSSDHHALEFFCDYLRMMTLGTENAHELADLIDEELETHHAEEAQLVTAYQTMGDGFPALGIVAAVLGVIKTMSSITEPPEVLGKLIGGALVGTFLGIFLAYGFVSPLAVNMNNVFEADSKYMTCIKSGLLAHVAGYAPAVSIEFARKVLMSKDRPSFFEVEEAVAALPNI